MRIRFAVTIFIVSLRLSVSETDAEPRPLRIKRESGANPEQSRCCDVHVRRVRIRFRQNCATAAPPAGRRRNRNESEDLPTTKDCNLRRTGSIRLCRERLIAPESRCRIPSHRIRFGRSYPIPHTGRSPTKREIHLTFNYYCNENNNRGCCIPCTGNEEDRRFHGNGIRHVRFFRNDGQRKLRLRKRKLGLIDGRTRI